jgi:hypothetical protein
MTPLEAVRAIRLALSDLIEEHCSDRARDDYYDGTENLEGMCDLLVYGPAICDKDRHAQEMWVLAWVHENSVAFHKTEIGDDIALPPIFADVEAMLKAPAKPPVASVSYSWDDIQGWLDQRGSDPDVPFAGHVWTPEQQADVMERLQEYLEMHVYESFGRTLYVEALDAEWEKIK